MHTKQKERCVRCPVRANATMLTLVDSQSPLYYDVRDVVISKRMSVILVSFEQVCDSMPACLLSCTSPRALFTPRPRRSSGNWRLSGTRAHRAWRVHSRADCTSSTHLRSMDRPLPLGRVTLGAKTSSLCFASVKVTNALLMCASVLTHTDAAGDMHIWDRETAVPLRYVRPMSIPKLRDLTCIEWNNALDEPLMFATGSHDGKVRVWSTAVVVQDGASGSATVVE